MTDPTTYMADFMTVFSDMVWLAEQASAEAQAVWPQVCLGMRCL
jgi:hypothetical protein